MPRLAFIYRTDTHTADRGPISWKADYAAEIWSNLEQIGGFAKQYEATAVLDGGDFFHVKAPTRNSHALVIRAAELHLGYPCPTFCVEGNHDLSYNSLDSIEKQPLGVLYTSKIFTQLREQVFKDGDLQVRVVGMPYSTTRSLEELRAIQKKPGDTYLIAIVHQLAADDPPPSVEDFFGEPVFRYSDLATADGPDIWMFGHWHKDQGIVSIGTKSFVNLGAVSRGALINENIERTPKVAFIEADAKGIRVSALPLIVAPAADVFDFETKERIERESESIDQFVTSIQQNVTIDPSASIEANIEALEFAQDVRATALDYLERARAQAGVG
jgi:DNA repair exonuclease SbcCD nuclease subunit